MFLTKQPDDDSKFCNVLNKKGYGLFARRVVILNHEINEHRREWLCIY